MRVFVIEAQVLFGPELARLVAMAGGTLVGTRNDVDLEALAQSHADVVVLDLDYTDHDVLDVIEEVLIDTPLLRVVVLTGEQERGWTAACRAVGAFAVVSKAAEDEVVDALRRVFAGVKVWDSRVEVA